MGKLILDLKDHLKEILWVLVIVYTFLGCLVLIFGRSVGYYTVTWIAIGLAFVATTVFAIIVFGEVLLNVILILCRRLVDRAK